MLYDRKSGCPYKCPSYERQPGSVSQDVCFSEKCTWDIERKRNLARIKASRTIVLDPRGKG